MRLFGPDGARATGSITADGPERRSPELTQMVYRIGDSVTNIISPMMSYFALIVAFIQKYDRKAGIGTVVATMLPYTIAFLIVWSALLIVWMLLGLPVGPDAPLMIESGL